MTTLTRHFERRSFSCEPF